MKTTLEKVMKNKENYENNSKNTEQLQKTLQINN